MKNILFLFSVTLFILSACVAPPKFRDSLDQGEETVSFVEDHSKKKDNAFVAAHAWVSVNYKSSHDVIQMADKEAGILIVKGNYPYAFPIDPPMNTAFWDGWVQYTLTIRLKDNKVKFEFQTGPNVTVGKWGNGMYFPKEKMPEVLSYYQNIKNDIMKEISLKRDDF